ncbi:hypothetical protein JKP88DRAFT_327394 [Tribonema minus]|uniref:Uncharacterized protein n=1 Tax=Tribonema minus TaxID=303371 RepID=A0A836CB36_9STRA|nr:hypothetical protein JKP88DRAFT_327394 [Tribonema minus]
MQWANERLSKELYDLAVDKMRGHDDFTLLRPVVEEWTGNKRRPYQEHVLPLVTSYKEAWDSAKANMTKNQFKNWVKDSEQRKTRDCIDKKRREFTAYADNTMKTIVCQAGNFMEQGSHLKLFWSSKHGNGLNLTLYRDCGTKHEDNLRERQTGEVLKYDFGPMLCHSMDVLDKLPGLREVIHALTLATARRSIEVLDPAFEYRDDADDNTSVIINKLAKMPDGSQQTEFKVQLLCNRQLFHNGLQYVRANCDGTTGKSRQLIRNNVNNMMAAPTYRFADFAALVEERFKRHYTVHINRHIAVAIHATVKGDEFSVQNAKALLGHRSIMSSLSYADMKHVPQCVVSVSPPADGSDDEDEDLESVEAGAAAGLLSLLHADKKQRVDEFTAQLERLKAGEITTAEYQQLVASHGRGISSIIRSNSAAAEAMAEDVIWLDQRQNRNHGVRCLFEGDGDHEAEVRAVTDAREAGAINKPTHDIYSTELTTAEAALYQARKGPVSCVWLHVSGTGVKATVVANMLKKVPGLLRLEFVNHSPPPARQQIEAAAVAAGPAAPAATADEKRAMWQLAAAHLDIRHAALDAATVEWHMREISDLAELPLKWASADDEDSATYKWITSDVASHINEHRMTTPFAQFGRKCIDHALRMTAEWRTNVAPPPDSLCRTVQESIGGLLNDCARMLQRSPSQCAISEHANRTMEAVCGRALAAQRQLAESANDDRVAALEREVAQLRAHVDVVRENVSSAIRLAVERPLRVEMLAAQQRTERVAKESGWLTLTLKKKLLICEAELAHTKTALERSPLMASPLEDGDEPAKCFALLRLKTNSLLIAEERVKLQTQIAEAWRQRAVAAEAGAAAAAGGGAAAAAGGGAAAAAGDGAAAGAAAAAGGGAAAAVGVGVHAAGAAVGCAPYPYIEAFEAMAHKQAQFRIEMLEMVSAAAVKRPNAQGTSGLKMRLDAAIDQPSKRRALKIITAALREDWQEEAATDAAPDAAAPAALDATPTAMDIEETPDATTPAASDAAPPRPALRPLPSAPAALDAAPDMTPTAMDIEETPDAAAPAASDAVPTATEGVGVDAAGSGDTVGCAQHPYIEAFEAVVPADAQFRDAMLEAVHSVVVEHPDERGTRRLSARIQRQ